MDDVPSVVVFCCEGSQALATAPVRAKEMSAPDGSTASRGCIQVGGTGIVDTLVADVWPCIMGTRAATMMAAARNPMMQKIDGTSDRTEQAITTGEVNERAYKV